MQNKITAVDYLIREFSAILGPLQTQGMQDLFLADAINKAKEMFTEQIEESFQLGKWDGYNHATKSTPLQDPSEYYKQIFKP